MKKKSSATTVDTTLNDIPDEILSHILSFLPLKEAFRTIFLSKRWIPLSYSLSIHFDGIQTESWINFRRMLDSIMLSPLAQQYTLKTFHIDHCRFNLCKSANSTINQWLEAAKRRHIQNIFLKLGRRVTLLPTIFSCKTLVVLKLRDLKLSSMFHCCVDLPLLETLSLIDVRLKDLEDLKKLIYGCPTLKDLKTSYVTATPYVTATDGGVIAADGGLTAGEYSKPLSRLIQANIRLFEVPFRAVPNVQFLTVTNV